MAANKSFDFTALLENHGKKYKCKPTQFVSVANGVLRRLENNITHRKSSRLTFFDRIRNLPRCESPTPKKEVLSKVEHRRMQLEKWKEDKEKKKKENASKKKKPFVTGVAHAPLKFVPPPPPPKAMPSTSGRVTRSQAKTNIIQPETKKTQNLNNQSFAPKNATFKPPPMKNIVKMPTLNQLPTKRVTQAKTSTTQTKPKVNKPDKQNTKLVDKRQTRSNTAKKMDSSKILTSTSSSEFESLPESESTESEISPVFTSKSPRKSIMANHNGSKKEILPQSDSTESDKSPVSKSKSPRKSITTKHVSKENLPQSDSTESDLSPVFKSKTPRKSITANRNISNMLTPKQPVPKSESSSEERLRSPKSPTLSMTPEQIAEEVKKISPCVTMSRGKDKARKEIKQKIEDGLLDDDAGNMESVEHFRRQLNSEIKRMSEMCDTWDKISEKIQLPEAVQEAVLGAVGQARLLMSQKLQQFASLLSRCERREAGRALVTPADLHGFWDMVFMQVENVDMRFKKLEEMRARNWAEEPVVVSGRQAPRPAAGARPAAARRPRPAAASRLRDVIAAARKAKKEQQDAPTEAVPAAEDSKTFEAGFFSVRSPVRAPSAPCTPNRPNAARSTLLKAVLSSEAKKSASKSSTSYAMLRASLISKNVDGDESALPGSTVPLTPINLYATPGRSILKSANVASTKKKSGKKSIKVVLFNESDGDIENGDKLETERNIESTPGIRKLEEDGTEEKENVRRKSRLLRQDATDDRSPVMTRSRRKSMQTPESSANVEKTPSRRRK